MGLRGWALKSLGPEIWRFRGWGLGFGSLWIRVWEFGIRVWEVGD